MPRPRPYNRAVFGDRGPNEPQHPVQPQPQYISQTRTPSRNNGSGWAIGIALLVSICMLVFIFVAILYSNSSNASVSTSTSSPTPSPTPFVIANAYDLITNYYDNVVFPGEFRMTSIESITYTAISENDATACVSYTYIALPTNNLVWTGDGTDHKAFEFQRDVSNNWQVVSWSGNTPC